MEKEFKDEFEYRYSYWFSELDNRPYHSNFLLKNGKVLVGIPNGNKKLGIDNMIGMYKARLIRK